MRGVRTLSILMMLLVTLMLSGGNPLAQRPGLAERIGHHDPSRYRAGRSHGGRSTGSYSVYASSS